MSQRQARTTTHAAFFVIHKNVRVSDRYVFSGTTKIASAAN